MRTVDVLWEEFAADAAGLSGGQARCRWVPYPRFLREGLDLVGNLQVGQVRLVPLLPLKSFRLVGLLLLLQGV